MRRRLKAQLVIPDASPLISLAKATLGNAGMMKKGGDISRSAEGIQSPDWPHRPHHSGDDALRLQI